MLFDSLNSRSFHSSKPYAGALTATSSHLEMWDIVIFYSIMEKSTEANCLEVGDGSLVDFRNLTKDDIKDILNDYVSEEYLTPMQIESVLDDGFFDYSLVIDEGPATPNQSACDQSNPLDTIAENVLEYVGGCLAKRFLDKVFLCPQCTKLFTREKVLDSNSYLLSFKEYTETDLV
ncbi:hypothetical protein JTE90_019414 [Oedothorax gibbosus]|uniref:Uncharacterized protein n=1 Tax=Oedothorax gibbosus TaxID=931172 RepID=A0AAV6TU40_9ARAC|nr:hypothetical protein JTE90_019414 [Oedothorax gibbosus]